MSLVTFDPAASQAVRSLLSEAGIQGSIRIELQFCGCCDPSLGLVVDTVRESDLVEEVDSLTFVISPEIHQLVGEVRISHADGGFFLTSSKPLSEWDGLAASRIRM